jgi:hypothetical protein
MARRGPPPPALLPPDHTINLKSTFLVFFLPLLLLPSDDIANEVSLVNFLIFPKVFGVTLC